MGLGPAHAMLKKRVVIDSWRRDLFIRPAVKNIHRRLFDSATQACLGAKVVAHSGGNSGEWLGRMVHSLTRLYCQNRLRQRVANITSCQNHLRQRVALSLNCEPPILPPANAGGP